ncbi:hypothetical protein [Marinifilum fragile]|uniref:hypothetical protein n=1 Tax=Marinifilum fragile TaxID=570161 RepID=UPI0012FCEF5B|nr:hypothetical protein [Marinifilum fragile]
MSILGLILFLAGTLFSFLGTNESDKMTTKSLSDDIKKKNDKIDSLISKIEEKDQEINNLKQWNNKISVKLLEQIKDRINPLFNTIIKCSKLEKIDLDNVDNKLMRNYCTNCNINSVTGTKKILSYSPLKLGDITVRESILNDWKILAEKLDEINYATTYIHPQAYELSFRIRKCTLALTIGQLGVPIKNTTLEAWSNDFYELLMLYRELKTTIETLQSEDMKIESALYKS